MPSVRQQVLAVGLGLLLIVGLLTAVLAYRQVPEGHAGVEKEWGAVTETTLDPGAHWKVPVMTTIQDVEIRPRTYTMSATRGEGDKSRSDAISVKTINGSSVDVDITIRYQINPSEADTFVKDWNQEQQMEQRLIRPTIRTVLRDEASSLQTTGTDAIYTQTGRAALEEAAFSALREEFAEEPITLEAVQIRNINLSNKIDQTLDQKEQAKQEVEVEKANIKQEEARAEQKIVQAEADAEAIEIRGEALRENQLILQQRYIEALKKGNTVYVPIDSGGVTLTRDVSASSNTTTTTGTG